MLAEDRCLLNADTLKCICLFWGNEIQVACLIEVATKTGFTICCDPS